MSILGKNGKVVALFLAFLMIFSSAGPVFADSLTKNDNYNTGMLDQYDDEFYRTVDQLEKYVEVNIDGTIKLNSSYQSEVGISEYHLNNILEWMKVLNDSIIEGEATIDKNLQVTLTDQDETEYQLTSNQNGFQAYWWGFKIFFNNTNTNILVRAIDNSVDSAALAVIISNMLPTPPTKLASGIAALAAWTLNKGSSIVTNANKGKGIYFRFAWPAVPTGVLGQ